MMVTYIDAPVQADDCAGTTNSTNHLDVPFLGGNKALQEPRCIPWWISCNDSCSLVCAQTRQINSRPPTLKPSFILFIISAHKIMKRVLHIFYYIY
jgi:hypothetical protein